MLIHKWYKLWLISKETKLKIVPKLIQFASAKLRSRLLQCLKIAMNLFKSCQQEIQIEDNYPYRSWESLAEFVM